MLDDLTDATDGGCSGGEGIGENNSETEVGLEEGMHHYTVAKLEDL